MPHERVLKGLAFRRANLDHLTLSFRPKRNDSLRESSCGVEEPAVQAMMEFGALAERIGSSVHHRARDARILDYHVAVSEAEPALRD